MKGIIKKLATEAGFALCGVTTAEPVADLPYIERAIGEGRTASMGYLARSLSARCDPRSILAGARSVICCALGYGDSGIKSRDSGFGIRNWERSSESRVPSPESRASRARFARGAEYHAEVMRRLEEVWEAVRGRAPDARAKLCCDASPLLEKALAQRAGLGWIGKHTVLVNREIGSWFVLGEIVTDLEIEPDAPHEDMCGKCTMCLDACPECAIVSPRELDARRCISYLTIEAPRLNASGFGTRDSGPGTANPPPNPESRIPSPGYGCALSDRALNALSARESKGCDLCQDACPYNSLETND